MTSGTTAAPVDAPQPHWIVIVGGGAGGLELATRLGDALGRRGRAEVTLDPGDLALSRRHAQVRPVGDGVAVFDLGSTNGTYVKLAKPTKLASGDEFRLASKRLRFELVARVAKLASTDVVVDAPPGILTDLD